LWPQNLNGKSLLYVGLYFLSLSFFVILKEQLLNNGLFGGKSRLGVALLHEHILGV
jgi:hypothetical protein